MSIVLKQTKSIWNLMVQHVPLPIRCSLIKIPFLFLLFFSHVVIGQTQQIGEELQHLSLVKDSTSLVNSLNKLGTLYRSRNTDSSFYYGMKAKQIAVNNRYQKGETEADHLIAYTLYTRGLYAQSLELFGKVLPRYEHLKDTVNIVRASMDMSEVLNKGISDKAEIVTLLQKAIQTGKTLKNDSIMGPLYLHYCGRNSSLSIDSVNFYLNKSKAIARRYKDDRLLLFHKLWDARLLILNGQKQEALPLIKQLIAHAQRTENTSVEINACFLMVAYCDTDPQMALDYCYQAYEVAQKNEHKYLIIYILNNALDVAKHWGNKDEIIYVYAELAKAMTEEWENSRKFMGDYVRYNTIENDNILLSQENSQRTLWLITISFSAAIILFTTYLIMSRRSRKAEEQIEKLNHMVNMQIISMEEVKHQAITEEQKRLGQDLHDGLSSSLAGIRIRLELISLDINDILLKNKLDTLNKDIMKAYEIARNKSHEWFYAAETQQEEAFERQIIILTDNVLPDDQYQKDIFIDNNALYHLTMDARIAILRIIQEAITNIIKHAKANFVSILIYEEEANLMLTIKDNGKGTNNLKLHATKSTIGIQSIHRRVKYLHGSIHIDSGIEGTEILIGIPIKV